MSLYIPPIHERHKIDDDQNPAGGYTESVGIAIRWQDGPLEHPALPNGAFVENVILSAIGRLEHYQRSKFACGRNEQAIANLKTALGELELRTKERVDRGVEGTHKV